MRIRKTKITTNKSHTSDKPLIALIYCRVSSDRQKNEGHGLEGQEQRCREFARKKGWEVEKVFSDSFTGGGDFMKRPAMSALLSHIDKHPYRSYAVVFDDLKRFARDTESHLKLRVAFKMRGVELGCPNFSFTDSPEGKFIETIIAAGGELEKEQNKRQVIGRQTSRLEAGYWTFPSKKPYKMVDDPVHGKVLKPQYPQATILKEAFEGFANGTFARKIDVCRFLVEKRYWSKQSPERYIEKLTLLLKDVLFAGYIEWPAWEISRRKGHHEGIISLDTYNAIQKRLNNEGLIKSTRTDTTEDFPMRGLCICSYCEKHITAGWSKGRNGRHGYYFCQNKECEQNRKSIRKSKFEKDFEEELKKQHLKPEVSILFQKVFDYVWEDEATKDKATVKQNIKLREDLEGKIGKLTEFVIDSKSQEVRAAYEKQIESISKQLNELESVDWSESLDMDIPYRTAIAKATTFLENPYKIWHVSSVEEKHRLFNFIFQQKLPYDIKYGYRTNKLSSSVRLFEQFATSNTQLVEMEGIEPSSI
jgi:site-specific DNA recombinase